MDERIAAELRQEEHTEFHSALLKHCRGLVDGSRREMSHYYTAWDKHDEIYRGYRTPDAQDKKAEQRGEPEKMVVPMSYAQVQTFVAFCFAVYFQRDRFFELVGMGEEDHQPAKVGEAVIARDLEHNVWESRLYQFLLDISRFGIGILKSGWTKETHVVTEEVETPAPSLLGMPLGKASTTLQRVERTLFEGNKIVNISPYRFFPDTRLPISRFQEGEFCASEDEYSLTQLKRMEKDGEVAGVQHVRKLTSQSIELRGDAKGGLARWRIGTNNNLQVGSATQTEGTAILTECQVEIIPADFKVDGEPLGPETWPQKWNVWYVNDQRVVKAEPLGYVHDEFTYDVGEYNPDMHHLVNEGLTGAIDQLQSVITWLINSHVTSVRKTIQNWLIVDPNGIEMKDLSERRPVIRLKPGAARTGVDKWVKQLDVQDVTSNHMADAAQLQQLVQIVTGINENALGQFHSGRRSATEARNVNAATTARLKMQAALIYKNALQPLARKMLSNLRDGLDEETYVRVMGELANPVDYYRFTKVSKADLVGEYDFEVFDGTLPSERQVKADAIQEVLLAYLQNPEGILSLGYDPQKLAEEWLELRGIRNPKRFKLDQVRLMELVQNMQTAKQLAENAGNRDDATSTGGDAGATQGPPQQPGSSISLGANGARPGGAQTYSA